jgi:SAM-dependent methyltransferase
VHPWIFAEARLRVVATELSSTALETLSQPERWPRLYGSAAYERWDIDQTCKYGGITHPEAFPPMAAIEHALVAASLRSRITFARADWTALPVDARSIDLVFSTNALPRDDKELMERVVAEWQRVLKPNGHLFLAMHNSHALDIAATFKRLGWTAVETFDAESTRLTCQPYFSSG